MPDETIVWGERLKARREDRGVSLETFAERFDVHPITVRRWEAGQSCPHRDVMQEIADYLETDPCAIFFRTGCGEAA